MKHDSVRRAAQSLPDKLTRKPDSTHSRGGLAAKPASAPKPATEETEAAE